MTTRAERLRWALALAGLPLFEAAFFMPMFGGAAKHRARCEGREFTGRFDDCFNDYLPILEMAAPFLGLILLYPFARFSFSLWAPDPQMRRFKWRLASGSPIILHWPLIHGFAGLGIVWTFWRASTYVFAGELWHYLAYWVVFAVWFGAALVISWPPKPERDSASHPYKY